jgi:hypothetical protein
MLENDLLRGPKTQYLNHHSILPVMNQKKRGLRSIIINEATDIPQELFEVLGKQGIILNERDQ